MKVTSLIIPTVRKALHAISLRSTSPHHRRQRYQPTVTNRHPASASFSVYDLLEMEKFSPVTHVIFDMDGLILDTEKIYHHVLGTIAKRYGKEFAWDVRMSVMGTTERDCAKIMVEGLDLPITPEEFHKQQVELQAVELKGAELMPGAERIIRHLHSQGVPIAVATSSSLASVKIKIEKHATLFSLFHHIVSGTCDPDVKRGKPHPDIFLVCSSRFLDHPHPSKCLVFEDAPNGVTAARTAGMQVVMVPDASTPEDRRRGATLVIPSLDDFKPELFGLPSCSS